MRAVAFFRRNCLFLLLGQLVLWMVAPVEYEILACYMGFLLYLLVFVVTGFCWIWNTSLTNGLFILLASFLGCGFCLEWNTSSYMVFSLYQLVFLRCGYCQIWNTSFLYGLFSLLASFLDVGFFWIWNTSLINGLFTLTCLIF